MTAVNRYTSSRSSHNMSAESSSINEADSASQLNSSKFEAHNAFNEDDEYKDNKSVVVNHVEEEEEEEEDDIDKHIKNYQFESFC